MTLGLNTTILAATTSAANSSEFEVQDGRSVTVYCSPNLGVAETADIQVSPDGGDTWVSYVDDSSVELSAVKNSLSLIGPALYRISKDATASPIGLYLQR